MEKGGERSEEREGERERESEGEGREGRGRGGGRGEEGGIYTGSRVMLSGRKYLERGWCPSGGGGSGPGRAEGQLVHLAEEHHRTRSGEREEGISPNTAVC